MRTCKGGVRTCAAVICLQVFLLWRRGPPASLLVVVNWLGWLGFLGAPGY